MPPTMNRFTLADSATIDVTARNMQHRNTEDDDMLSDLDIISSCFPYLAWIDIIFA